MSKEYWAQWSDLDESDINDRVDTNSDQDEVDTNLSQDSCCASGCMECVGFDY